MGAMQFVEEGDTLSGPGTGRSAQLERNDISAEFRGRIHGAIQDAHASTSRPIGIAMPWEQPSMSWIFDQSDPLGISIRAAGLGGIMLNQSQHQL